MSPAPLHRRLWEDNSDLARACLDHPFVRGLAAGDLDVRAFRGYVAQDAFFLRSFLAAYALAAARCVDHPERFRTLHRLQDGVLQELELHAGYARRLGIDLERVRPFAATSAYTDFLLRVAWSGEPGEIVAAMTPCLRLYAFLGRELAATSRADNPYREWIDTYAGEEFESLAASLERLLDETAGTAAGAADAYRYALACELDFFSAPLEEATPR